MEPIKVGLLGFGTVGSGTFTVLRRNQEEIKRRAGRGIEVARIAVRNPAKARAALGDFVNTVDVGSDFESVVDDPAIDIVAEMIGGTGIARELVLRAIAHGKHVVTANKALLAVHGTEIFEAARAKGVMVAFEAAVAGGIPIIKALREGLTANRIQSITGIINGTTNYILSEMRERGLDFATALKQAQALGYAEADPTFDVGGFDTANKLAILASLCFGCEIAPDEVFVEGITTITQADIKVAGDLGYKIKLLGIAQRSPEGIEQRVHPTLVPKSSAIAGVDGVLNAVALETDHVHELLLAGPGAGGPPTASSVLSDILDIARGTRVPPLGVPSHELVPYRQAPMKAHEGGYYIRLNARDVPGALGAVARRMGEAGISLESVIQRPDLRVTDTAASESSSRTIVLLTHSTLEQSVREALALIAADGFIVGMPQLIRIESL